MFEQDSSWEASGRPACQEIPLLAGGRLACQEIPLLASGRPAC